MTSETLGVDHGSLGSSGVEELSQPSLAMARCLDSSPGFRDREFEPASTGFRDRKSTFSVLVSGTGPSPGFRDRVLFFLAARFPIDTAVLLLAARDARATAMASSIVLILRQSCIGGSDWLLRPCANVTRKRFGFRCSELPPRPRSVTRMKPSASASLIAGATASLCTPKAMKACFVTGNRPLS